MRWVARVLVTVAIALATTVVAFDASSLRDEPGWRPGHHQVIAAIVVIGFGVLWNFADAEVERRRGRRRNEMGFIISDIAFPVWADLQNEFHARELREGLGVHVWMVPSWHWAVVPQSFRNLVPEKARARLPTPPMWRAVRIRMDTEDQPTDIAWRRDVGVLGKCWRDRKSVYLDLVAHWGPVPMSEQAFGALPGDGQYGLTYQQYLSVAAKYASVLAIPVYEDPDNARSRFIGCVVFDSIKDAPINLDSKRIRGKAWVASKTISRSVVRRS